VVAVAVAEDSAAGAGTGIGIGIRDRAVDLGYRCQAGLGDLDFVSGVRIEGECEGGCYGEGMVWEGLGELYVGGGDMFCEGVECVGLGSMEAKGWVDAAAGGRGRDNATYSEW
jgi:hypothetical protein